MLTGTLFLPLAPAYANSSPSMSAQMPAVHNQSTKGTLSWGFHSSFVSYIGENVSLADGATSKNGIYNFPLDTVTQNGKTQITLTGKGTVRFTDRCENIEEADTCQIDLTLSNPKLVLDAQGISELMYTVRTRNYQSGEIEGPQELTIATVDLQGARQKETNEKITWSKAQTTLTEAGAHALSDFYPIGSSLTELNFSYQGKALETQPSKYSIGERWNTGTDYRHLHRLNTTAKSLILRQNHPGTYTVFKHLPSAFVKSSREMYWVVLP